MLLQYSKPDSKTYISFKTGCCWHCTFTLLNWQFLGDRL